MRKWGCAIFMALVACAGAPAAWASDSDIAFTDPCGDNHAFVQVNQLRQEVPATPRTPRFDLKAVKIASVTGGVAVSFSMCEAPGMPDGFRGWRAVYPRLADDCTLAIIAYEPAVPGQPREPRIIKTCWNGPEKSPVPALHSDTSDTRFDITLPADAITVSGETLTLTVKRAGLTGEAAQAFAPGAVWKATSSWSAENATLLGAGGDTNGNYEADAFPTGFDWAWGGENTAFVVS